MWSLLHGFLVDLHLKGCMKNCSSFWSHFEVSILMHFGIFCRFKRATRMNTVLNYVIELDLINCPAKFRGNTISRSQENGILSCNFLCRLRSIATHRDHFVRRLSVCLSVCHTPIAMFCRRHMHFWECCHYFGNFPDILELKLSLLP